MVDKKKNKGTLKKVFSYIGKYKYFLILSIHSFMSLAIS